MNERKLCMNQFGKRAEKNQPLRIGALCVENISDTYESKQKQLCVRVRMHLCLFMSACVCARYF